MRYHALACDYDGTLAQDGKIAPKTVALLEKLLSTGRKLILVTGRELDDLRTILKDEGKLFHSVVAENGAVLYDPAADGEKMLAPPIPPNFLEALRARGVKLSSGRAIVSTQRSEEAAVVAAVRELGLELQLIANRDALMVLPAGVNKATGLAAALDALGLSAHEVVGVGDAENDHAFLDVSEFSAAVANALPSLKEHVDWVTPGSNGKGVGELIEELAGDDLVSREKTCRRRGQPSGDAL